MKKLSILICLLASFSLSYSQRKKADQDFRNVRADNIVATQGTFTHITSNDSTEIDNANGIGDSLVLFTPRGLKFKKIRMGNNIHADYEGDSVITFNSGYTAATQTFFPKAGETNTNSEGLTYTGAGTLVARVPTSTNLLSASTRVGLSSASTAGSIVYMTSSTPSLWRGNNTGKGGFYAYLRFGIPTSVSNSMQFFGVSANSITSSVNPSTLLSLVGVGKDATDASFQFMTNDSSGTASKTSTGIAISNTSLYELTVSCAANSSSITVVLKDLSTGNSASTTLSSNLPINTQFLRPVFYMSNNTTAASIALDISKLYTESKY